jgi:hypothetical protein
VAYVTVKAMNEFDSKVCVCVRACVCVRVCVRAHARACLPACLRACRRTSSTCARAACVCVCVRVCVCARRAAVLTPPAARSEPASQPAAGWRSLGAEMAGQSLYRAIRL